jgi:glycosyltransferase involved in cell wall biosynthesis
MNPADGGPVTAIRDCVRATARFDCHSEIVCLDPGEAAWLLDQPCPVTALGAGRGPFRTNARLEEWMIDNSSRFDSAVVHGLWLYPTRCAAVVHRATGLPFAVYTHGMLDIAHRRNFPIRHVKKSLWWIARERQVLNEAGAIFFTSAAERDLAARTFWPRIRFERAEIVPYCVEPPPADSARHIATFRNAFPELGERRLILFLSRIHPKKGVDLMIDAFASVAGSDVRLRLMIAGPGSPTYIDKLQAMAVSAGVADRIIWPGMLQGDLKWGALRAAELFCLPSHQENFGIVIAESLACGTPVMITDRVNIAPIPRAAGAGLVSRDTRQGVTSTLKQWLSLTARERSAMGNNAVGCFERDFAADAAALRFLEALPSRAAHSAALRIATSGIDQ